MIVVLVGEHDQLEILDRDAVLGQPGVERGLGLVHQRAGVDQRERLAAQQPRVDVAEPNGVGSWI